MKKQHMTIWLAVMLLCAALAGCGEISDHSDADSQSHFSKQEGEEKDSYEDGLEDDNSGIPEDEDASRDYEYAFYDDGTAIITRYVGESEDIAIPSRLDGYLVTQIREGAFSGTPVRSVRIPGSVTVIGIRAFRDSTYLESVEISEGVTEIGQCAFEKCVSLKNINIPDSVTAIGPAAFWYSGLESVTIPDSVTTIGGAAFSNCSNLISIVLPDHLTKLESGLFEYCENLKSITIPDSVTEIGTAAFYRCKSLTSVTVPASVTNVSRKGNGQFFGCPRQLTVHCPSGSAMEQYAIENGISYVSE